MAKHRSLHMQVGGAVCAVAQVENGRRQDGAQSLAGDPHLLLGADMAERKTAKAQAGGQHVHAFGHAAFQIYFGVAAGRDPAHQGHAMLGGLP
jgi:hypothetical protein